MIVGQTVFSVRKGTEHRAEVAMAELQRLFALAPGLRGHRVFRSFAMSPIGSALHHETCQAQLGDLHYVVQTEWTAADAHDEFLRDGAVGRVYAALASILTGGPFEVLYHPLETPRRCGVTV